MQKISLLLLTAVLSTSSLPTSAAGMIYKCKNPQGGGMSYQKSPCVEDEHTVSSWEESSPERKSISIRQGRGGHYFLPGTVNGTDFTFVIDTGATTVALPSSIAESANLVCRGDMTLTGTANGVTPGCYVTLPKLSFGPFQLSNVEAIILPNLGQPLLGMNALQRFNLKQEHGEMSISEW